MIWDDLTSIYFIDETDKYPYMIFFLSIEDFEIYHIEKITNWNN